MPHAPAAALSFRSLKSFALQSGTFQLALVYEARVQDGGGV